jgi:hypothetical protein
MGATALSRGRCPFAGMVMRDERAAIGNFNTEYGVTLSPPRAVGRGLHRSLGELAHRHGRTGGFASTRRLRA